MPIVPCVFDTTDNEIYVLSTDRSTRVNSYHLHHVQLDLDSSKAKLCFGTNYYGLMQKFSAATKILVGPNHKPRNPITNRVLKEDHMILSMMLRHHYATRFYCVIRSDWKELTSFITRNNGVTVNYLFPTLQERMLQLRHYS